MRISKLTKLQMRAYQRRYGNDQRIADALGVTRQSIYHRRKELDIPSLRINKPKRDKQIREMHAKGRTAREVAAKFGLSEIQTHRILNHKS